MCPDCWDERWREDVEGVPWPKESGARLKCLCARREGLQVLLVCRQWYVEAGHIFYTRNTFAFESAGILTDFVHNLRPYRRLLLTKVSLMAESIDPQSEDATPEEEASGFESSKKLAKAWSALRTLPALTYLELDALFLTRAKTVRGMLHLGRLNVRSVCFTARNPAPPNPGGSTSIYPAFQQPILVVGCLAEEVARKIKGEACPWFGRLAPIGAIEEATAEKAEAQKSYAENRDLRVSVEL